MYSDLVNLVASLQVDLTGRAWLIKAGELD